MPTTNRVPIVSLVIGTLALLLLSRVLFSDNVLNSGSLSAQSLYPRSHGASDQVPAVALGESQAARSRIAVPFGSRDELRLSTSNRTFRERRAAVKRFHPDDNDPTW